jgi:hypothetical protein
MTVVLDKTVNRLSILADGVYIITPVKYASTVTVSYCTAARKHSLGQSGEL